MLDAPARTAAIGTLALLLVAGCQREPPERRTGPAEVAPSAVGRVTTASAFDLVTAPEGAWLAFAPIDAAKGAVALRALDAFGHARGAARPIVRAPAPAEPQRGEVVELALASAGSRLAIAFIEHAEDGLHTRALLFAPGAAPQAPELLASAPLARPRGRGHVAVAAAEGGRARVLYLSRESECIEQDRGPCFGFGFRELSATPSTRGAREGDWLSVPQPCSEGAATLAALPGRFFYAICSAAQSPQITTAYAISIEPQYARADPVLRGCAPLGITPIDADHLLLGADCNGERRAARLGPATQAPAEFPLVDAALTCNGGRLRIAALGLSLDLDHPQDRLEAVLPAAVAPVGSRAVFTGRALLVAQRMSEQLVLQRYACEDGVLQVKSSAVRSAPNPG